MRGSGFLHFLDRYLGIPLVFFLGRLKRKRLLPPMPKQAKIGLLNTAAIGDTILLSAVIADLRLGLSLAEFHFFCGPSNYEAALLIPGIRVVKIPATHPHKAIPLMRKETFDLWIDFGQWARLNALYTYFAKAKFKIGFKTPGQYRHYIYDKTAEHELIHELDNYRKLISIVGVPSKSSTKLTMGRDAMVASNRIVLHLYAGGSRSSIKQWPEERWIQLIDYLTDGGHSITLTGTAKDREKCERVRMACRDVEKIDLAAGTLSLRETALLLASSKAVVSVDTGIMHLAATLGCPTVALHGPTSPDRWGGIGPRVIPVVPSCGYAPCLHLGFEKICSSNRCMQSISLLQVIKALIPLIKNKVEKCATDFAESQVNAVCSSEV